MEVVGRHDVLQTIATWLEEASGDVLLIEGEAGIGKTTVWRASIDAAADRGYRVLRSRPARVETQLSFAVLRDLLADVFDDVEDELPEPQRHTLAATLLREAPHGEPPEQGAIGVSIVSALRVLSRRGPTIVAVDDVQWLDSASRASLRYAFRRLTPGDVRILLARRITDDSPQVDLIDSERMRTLEIGPLSVGALGHILHAHGMAFPRPTLRRIDQVSGGNPFFALELGRSLVTAYPLTPGAPLPVPGSLRELVGERLGALPAETKDALVVASALSRPTLDQIEAALDRPPDAALAPALEAGVVETEGTDLRFAHPLFAAAAYELVPETRHAELHRRLAAIVDDPEERGRHLALGVDEPDEQIAAAVDSSARAAAARGAFASAAELSEEARRLTPDDHVTERSRRALEGGWYRFTAGDPDGARRLLEKAAASSPPGDLRVEAQVRLAWLEHHSGDRRSALRSLHAIELDESTDPALRADVHRLIALSHYIMRDDLITATRHARAAVETSEQLEDPAGLVSSLTTLAMCEFLTGGGLPSPEMERALGISAERSSGRLLRQPIVHHASMLFYADRFAEARDLLVRAMERAAEMGDESVLPWPLSRLAHLELLAGNWTVAATHADEGLDLAIQTAQLPLQADLLGIQALVLVHRGEVDEGRSAALDALRLAEGCGAGVGRRLSEAALGLIELTLDDPETAAERLLALKVASDAASILDPGENRYVGDLGEALVKLGRTTEAQQLAAAVERLGGSLARPSAVALGARVRGLALLELGDIEGALAGFADALAAHRRSCVPFEHARTLVALGVAQRRGRQRRAARESLGGALAAFEELGASLWATRAREELRRIGGRTRSSGALTPTEERVAALVAEGKANKEVAAELVLSVHTVEAALTSIYRKLDVRSRAGLAHKLTAGSKH